MALVLFSLLVIGSSLAFAPEAPALRVVGRGASRLHHTNSDPKRSLSRAYAIKKPKKKGASAGKSNKSAGKAVWTDVSGVSIPEPGQMKAWELTFGAKPKKFACARPAENQLFLVDGGESLPYVHANARDSHACVASEK